MAISFDLTGKNILVTGASSGIGRAIAIAAAEAGAFVVLVARNEERLRETVVDCGEKCAIELCDLSDLDKLPRFVMNLAKKYGAFSGLVHSAGIGDWRPLKMIRAANLLDAFTVNCASAIMLVKGLSAHGCFDEKGTSVVMISSVAGGLGVPGQIAYGASKGGLETAVKCMALELIPLRIRVNAVAPALIQTPLLDDFEETGSQLSDAWQHKHPSGIGDVNDVAAAVLYLLSAASRYVVGTTLCVDGGYCAQ